MKRVLTALLLIPTFCYLVLWAPWWAFVLSVVAVALLCYHEFIGLAALHEIDKPGVFGYAAGMLILLVPVKDPPFYVLISILAFALGRRSRNLGAALPSAAAFVFENTLVFR